MEHFSNCRTFFTNMQTLFLNWWTVFINSWTFSNFIKISNSWLFSIFVLFYEIDELLKISWTLFKICEYILEFHDLIFKFMNFLDVQTYFKIYKYFFFQWAYVCSFKSFGRMDQHVSWANLMLPRKLSSNTKSWCSNQDQWTHHEIPPKSARKRHWHLATRIIQPNKHHAEFRKIKQKQTKIRGDGHNLLYLQYKTKPARSLCKAN